MSVYKVAKLNFTLQKEREKKKKKTDKNSLLLSYKPPAKNKVGEKKLLCLSHPQLISA